MSKSFDFSTLVTLDRVLSAYNGAEGCMCGCNGTYVYQTAYRDEAGSERGYAVSDDEVSDRKVKSRLNKLLKMVSDGDYDTLNLYAFGLFVTKGGRVTAVYFRK